MDQESVWSECLQLAWPPQDGTHVVTVQHSGGSLTVGSGDQGRLSGGGGTSLGT